MKLAKHFGELAPMRVSLHYPPALVAQHVTVVLLKNGRIEVCGPIEQEEFCVKLLALGVERIRKFHAQQRSSRLVGPGGQPVASQQEGPASCP
jgi:hypothetical protein